MLDLFPRFTLPSLHTHCGEPDRACDKTRQVVLWHLLLHQLWRSGRQTQQLHFPQDRTWAVVLLALPKGLPWLPHSEFTPGLDRLPPDDSGNSFASEGTRSTASQDTVSHFLQQHSGLTSANSLLDQRASSSGAGKIFDILGLSHAGITSMREYQKPVDNTEACTCSNISTDSKQPLERMIFSKIPVQGCRNLTQGRDLSTTKDQEIAT